MSRDPIRERFPALFGVSSPEKTNDRPQTLGTPTVPGEPPIDPIREWWQATR